MESRTFDTSTLQGLKLAERYKAYLSNKYERVTVSAVGLNRVKVYAVRLIGGAR